MNAVTVPAQRPSTTVESVGKTTTEVGRVFGQGGTDGLILYALILAAFLMFLALVLTLFMSFRAIARRDGQVLEQSKAFADASKETADALTALSVAISAKDAGDMQYRSGLTATLARLEGQLARDDHR